MSDTVTGTLDAISKLSDLAKDIEETMDKIEDLKKLIEDLRLNVNGTTKTSVTDKP